MGVLWSLVLAVVGLIVLTKAADMFVDGAVALSERFGISPVVVGAVVVGFGTSAPEMLVSILAAAEDDPAIGVGNIVGSNVANLSLVLGTAALVAPIAVPPGVLRREAPLSVAGVALFGFLLRDGLTLTDGVILLVCLVAAATWLVRSTPRDAVADIELPGAEELMELRHAPRHRMVLVTVVGLVGTALGAQLLVTGAVRLADAAGLSSGFVGVTLVAVGTSLPELVTAIQAARKGHQELIVGNVLGSNLFNSLAVGGAMGLFDLGDVGDPQLTGRGNLVMVLVSVAALVMMWRRRMIVRFEGALLLAGYAAVVVMLR